MLAAVAVFTILNETDNAIKHYLLVNVHHKTRKICQSLFYLNACLLTLYTFDSTNTEMLNVYLVFAREMPISY